MKNYCLLQDGDIIDYGDLTQYNGCGEEWFEVDIDEVGLIYTREEYMPMKRLLEYSYLKKDNQWQLK